MEEIAFDELTTQESSEYLPGCHRLDRFAGLIHIELGLSQDRHNCLDKIGNDIQETLAFFARNGPGLVQVFRQQFCYHDTRVDEPDNQSPDQAAVQCLIWREQIVSGQWLVFHREVSKALTNPSSAHRKYRPAGSIDTRQPPFAVGLLQQLSDELSINIWITFILAFTLEPDSTRQADARVIDIDGTRDIPA
jgi:hypothetical protein